MIAAFLERLLKRLPIGWLQLRHKPGRLAAAVGGVTFATLLVFMQLGFLRALVDSIGIPYRAFNADIMVSSVDMNTLADGGPIPRFRKWEVQGVSGVDTVVPLFYGRIDWKQADGTIRTLDVFGVPPDAPAFRTPAIQNALINLSVDQTALVDRRTRNLSPEILDILQSNRPFTLELRNREIQIIGNFDWGGGFAADGFLIVSDQTFLRLFPNRSSAAPNHLLVMVTPDADPRFVVQAIKAVVDGRDSRASLMEETIARDQSFQTTQRPVGMIFGFGLVIGIIVGMIIVYQILSADVADHLREYATLKAVGYPQRFFLGIVVEEAAILAVLGFVPGLLGSLALYFLVSLKTGLPLHMDLARPVMVLTGTLLACIASGALATRKLAKADPADLF